MEDSTDKKPYRLGVALSGGGARGLAHAGALKAIEDAGLKPDIIAGVSSGSVVAVLYAAGVRPDMILKMFTEAHFSDLAEIHPGGGGLLKMDRFRRYILRCIGGERRLENLPIPTYIGVTDFDNGKPVAMHEGDIGPILQASCSIPIVFRPVRINGVNYVDGGVLKNLPAWIIRDKCERLIGINVSPLNLAGSTTSIIDIAMRTYSLMAKSNQYHDMVRCDLVVQTREISHHKVFKLKDITNVFNTGYENTRKALIDKGWAEPSDFRP